MMMMTTTTTRRRRRWHSFAIVAALWSHAWRTMQPFYWMTILNYSWILMSAPHTFSLNVYRNLRKMVDCTETCLIIKENHILLVCISQTTLYLVPGVLEVEQKPFRALYYSVFFRFEIIINSPQLVSTQGASIVSPGLRFNINMSSG